MKRLWLFFVYGLLNLPANAQPQKVVIIRHAEKPATGGNLSCQGFNRAMQLPEVLHKKFGVPTEVYVPDIKSGKDITHSRMYQTIMPFAVKYNLHVNSKHNDADTKDLAKDIRKKTGTVLVVWEHKNINDIVRAFGIKEVAKWDKDDYDTILILSYTNGKYVLSRDKEGLHPSAKCS